MVAGDVGRILVIRPGGLGDAILMRPMLDALRESFPGARLDVLAERRNAAALRIGNPDLAVLCYDERPWRLLRQLRATRYDLIIDTEQYHHLSVLLANWLRPRWLCGFATLGRERLHTHPVAHAESDYEALSFLRLAECVTGRHYPFEPDRPFVAADDVSLAWADDALADAAGRRVVAITPGAGGAYRIWPAQRYADVARWLAGRGYYVALLGGADAVGRARVIAAACDRGSSRDFTAQTTLAQTAALLRRSALSVSADTGVLHLAYGLGTPTVALFGPGLHRKWAPPGRNHRIVRTGLPCSPCTLLGRVPPCPIGVACMQDMAVPQVIGAISEAMTEG